MSRSYWEAAFPTAIRSQRKGIKSRGRRTYHYGARSERSGGTSTDSSSSSSSSSSSRKGDSITTNTTSSAFDFRSDTITTPTPSMLAALVAGVSKYDDDGTNISSSSSNAKSTNPLVFGDDVYGEDSSTASLERRIASLTGHEAGLLVPSGTMANQIAVRTHLSLNRRKTTTTTTTTTTSTLEGGRGEGSSIRGPPYSILCDARAHILNSEAGGAAALSGAMVQGVMPRNGRYLTLEEDVLPHATVSGLESESESETRDFIDGDDNDDVDIHLAPTAVVTLENTLYGMIFPLEEMRRIADWTRRKGIALHLDGARLWEAAAAAAAAGHSPPDLPSPTVRALHSYGRIPDSASLCLSKGLCAPIGTVLVGSERFIRHARRVRKMLGGGIRMAGLIAVPARVALEEVFMGRSFVADEQAASLHQTRHAITNKDVHEDVHKDKDGHEDKDNGIDGDDHPGSTLRKTHATVQRLARFWTSLNDDDDDSHHHHDNDDDNDNTKAQARRRHRTLHPPQTNQLWLDLAAADIPEHRMQALMLDAGLKGGAAGRFVVHAQICEDAVRRLEGVLGGTAKVGRRAGGLEGKGA